MQHSTNAPTKSQIDRFELFREIGCIVCLVYFGKYREPDVSHLLDGGIRIGHDGTIPECPWHHRGVPTGERAPDQMRRVLGPSRIDGSMVYADRFGCDSDLREMTDAIMTKIVSLKRSSPIRQRNTPPTQSPSEQIIVREWMIVDRIAVRTRSIRIATNIAERTQGEYGFADGVEWMSLELFEQRCAA